MDGSSNQQGNGAGIILEGPNELLIAGPGFAFKASNNQAEYEALVEGPNELLMHYVICM